MPTFTEYPYIPRTVTLMATGEYVNGALIDSGKRYQGGWHAPRSWRTFQSWMFVASDWPANIASRIFYEPSSTSGALSIYYNSGTGNGAGEWRFTRRLVPIEEEQDPLVATNTHLIPRGEWHHITVVYDDDELRFYVDGVLEFSDDSHRWFQEYHEGTTHYGNQYTAAANRDYANNRPAFSHGAVFRAFDYAMQDAEVAETWNKILWPGYEGMMYQVVGLDNLDSRNADYIDNYCWAMHYEAVAFETCTLNQAPPVPFPQIWKQEEVVESTSAVTVDIDMTNWTPGNLTAWPADSFIIFDGATYDATFGAVVEDTTNGNYVSLKPKTGAGTAVFRNYVDTALDSAFDEPHVARGGMSLIVLTKDFYRSDCRLYLSLGVRPGYQDGCFCFAMMDTYSLNAIATNGALSTVLATNTPGTSVTRAWYFHEVEWVPSGTPRSDGAYMGTFRARWWKRADGINNPPANWNLSVNVANDATHKRYLCGGVGKQFLHSSFLEYSSRVHKTVPQFAINFQISNSYTSYIQYVRIKEHAYEYTPPTGWRHAINGVGFLNIDEVKDVALEDVSEIDGVE